MKLIDHVIMFQNLQVYVWRYATNLLDILQWFDGKNATDKAIVSGLLVNDGVDRFGMWGESVNEHYKIWGDWLKKIDLESVDRELFDDCPDDTTLTNRLRIVKLRAGNMWGENEFQTLFHEVLYSFERLKSIVFATYEVDEPQAHKMAKQIHDNFTLKLIDVKRLQDYLQTVISKAENLLNPQSDTSTEQTVKRSSILEDKDIKSVFNAFIENGYMEVIGKLFHWNKSPHLLAFFCEKVSLYFLNSSKTYEGKDATDWKKFSGLFEIETKGKLEYPDNDRLRAYKNNWYRGKDRKHTPFQPDGYKEIENILSELH